MKSMDKIISRGSVPKATVDPATGLVNPPELLPAIDLVEPNLDLLDSQELLSVHDKIEDPANINEIPEMLPAVELESPVGLKIPRGVLTPEEEKTARNIFSPDKMGELNHQEAMEMSDAIKKDGMRNFIAANSNTKSRVASFIKNLFR